MKNMKKPSGRNCVVERGNSCWLTATCIAWLCALLLSAPAFAQSTTDRIRDAMEDATNPLVRVATARGDFHVELYREAAPASVEWFLSIAGQSRDGTLRAPSPVNADDSQVSHYAGQTFNRILPGVLIQSSGPALHELPEALAARAPAPEINATILGLDQQPLLDSGDNVHPWLNITDRARFEQRILVPLYREMGIQGRETLDARTEAVITRLQNSTISEAYRRLGYRFDEDLPSRPPRVGSLLLLAATPQQSSATIAVTLTEAQWLRGQHTVIGQVVDGMPVVRALGSRPRAGTPPATIYRIETEPEENGS